MEEILIKLADILDMSVDGVLEAYPVLRGQFVNSYLWSQLGSIVGGLAILTGIVVLWFLIDFLIYGNNKQTIKNLVISLIVFFILMIVGILIADKTVQLAPDLLFLESLSCL